MMLRLQYLLSLASLVTVLSVSLLTADFAEAAGSSRVLKFSGVPITQAGLIRKRFPFVFEREVTLSEVDDVVRFLMATGGFSGVEVVERPSSTGSGHELVLVASVLRRVQDIKVEGNHAISVDEVKRVLDVNPGEPFERKNLVAAVNELSRVYETLGYHNTKVEVEFNLPNENEVVVVVQINEGPPLRVSDIAIDSPNAELAGRLGRMARSLKKHILTDDELADFQKDAADYLRENRYLTARISRSGLTYSPTRTEAKLIYSVENPYKFEFRVAGNVYFSEGSIISQIENEKLSGATSSPAPDMAERVRRMYQAVGFSNVEVSFTENLNEKSWRQLIQFKIKENPRVRIKKIEIAGNVSRPEGYYTQFIKSSSSDLIGSGFYNRKDVDDGTKKLITELQNQGFLRAKIQSTRAEYSKEKNSVTIVINVDEGPLTQIRQIRFEGAESFARNQLLDLLKVKGGAALSLKDLEDSLQALKDFYHAQGFLEMRISNEGERNQIITYNESNTQATIEFKIHEGPKVTVGSIALQGNTFTKDFVILREIAFQPGDTLTPTKQDESVFRLQRLGLFSRVSIRTIEEGTEIASRTVIIEVVDRDPGLFTLGLGVTNERQLTFRGYLGVAYRNILGTGRAVSFRVDPQYSTDPRISYIENRITLSYIEPYIFGDRNRGRINVVRDQRAYDYSDPEGAIMLEENAVGLLLERDITRHIKLTYTGYSFSNQRYFGRRSRDTTKTQNIAKIGPLIEFDFRDDIFNPSKGSYSFINLEYSDPLFGSSDDAVQTIQFFKANASVTTYVRLTDRKDWVWANSVRGGYLANMSHAQHSGVPSIETFSLGGRSTIRGFDATDLERVPNIIDLGVTDLSNFIMTSDSYYYLLKTEFRFPIWKAFPLGELGGAIFYDGGAVLISQPDVNIPDPYRDSVGIGLRVATPVGPLNVELGWKLDRRLLRVQQPYDIREAPWAFHFSIGAF